MVLSPGFSRMFVCVAQNTLQIDAGAGYERLLLRNVK